jgi:NADH pyrophosphatase NudC (nudix superfamily)
MFKSYDIMVLDTGCYYFNNNDFEKAYFCPRCGGVLTPSPLKNQGYTYACEQCCEDFYTFEVDNDFPISRLGLGWELDS